MTQEKPQGPDTLPDEAANAVEQHKDTGLDVGSAPRMAAEISPEAYRDNLQASLESVAQYPITAPVEPMKGVGFLGRRGTAPINTLPATPEEAGAAASATPPPPLAIPQVKHEDPPLKPGMAENSFRLMSYAGLLFLLLLLTLQTAAGIYFPSIFLPQEVALVQVHELMSSAGQWLAPPATAALPAALPGYLWFMAGVDMLPGLHHAFFLPVVAALSALVALCGTYILGLCTGLGSRVSFAAGLMLLSALGFVPLTHWLGPDMLLAGLLALSLACLHKGWASERAFLWLGLGFILAGAGTLTGGLPALWIPLLASLIFIFWRGTLRRGHRLDAVLGFGLLIACLAAWLGAVILLTGESAAMLAPLFDQLIAPLLPPLFPPKDVWWKGVALLGASLLPWIFVPLFVSWNKVAAEAWPALKAARKEKCGVAWLWICFGCGVALLVVSSAKPWLMAVPLLPVAALLLAKALLNLSHTSSRLFFLLLALLCLGAGATLSAAGIPAALTALKPHIPACLVDVAAQSAGLPLLGGVLLLTALTLAKFTNRAYPGGTLAVFVLMVTMLVQPATLLTGPSHAGRLAVHMPKGMGVGVLPGAPLVPIVPAETAPAETAPVETAPAKPVTSAMPETVAPAAPVPQAAPAPATTPAAEVTPSPPAVSTPADVLAPVRPEQGMSHPATKALPEALPEAQTPPAASQVEPQTTPQIVPQIAPKTAPQIAPQKAPETTPLPPSEKIGS